MKVFVENLEFVGRHGVYSDERDEGRLFRVDVAAELDRYVITDDVDETLDYRRLVNHVLEIGTGRSLNLVETMAWRILDMTFDKHPAVCAMTVKIRKRVTELAGEPEWVGTVFELNRDEWQALREG